MSDSVLLATMEAEKAQVAEKIEQKRATATRLQQDLDSHKADLQLLVEYLDELDGSMIRLRALWNGDRLPPKRIGPGPVEPAPEPVAPARERKPQPVTPKPAGPARASANANVQVRSAEIRAEVTRLLGELGPGEWIAPTALAERVGCNRGAIHRALKAMVEAGTAKHNGKGGPRGAYRPHGGRSGQSASPDAAERPSEPPSSTNDASSSSPAPERVEDRAGRAAVEKIGDAMPVPGGMGEARPAPAQPDLSVAERDRAVAEKQTEVSPQRRGYMLKQLREDIVDAVGVEPGSLNEPDMVERFGADREDVALICGRLLEQDLLRMLPDGRYTPAELAENLVDPGGPSRRVAKLEREGGTIVPRSTDGLTDRQQKIIKWLKDEPMNARQLAQGLVVNHLEVGTDLRFLVARGLIRARGDGSFEVAATAAAA